MNIPQAGILIRQIIGNINYYISDKLKPHNIKHGQFEYFMIIKQDEGINQNQLAEIKGVGKASVTKAVNVLETQGYIMRKTGEDDKRNVSLYCTEKGNEIVGELTSYKLELESTVFKDFTDYERSELIRLLAKMRDNTKELRGDNNG